MARFPTSLLPLVALSAAVAAVPTPKSHFGHEIGVDRVLLDWDPVVSYFYALEKSSPDRIQVREIGKTAEGRPLIAATFASPETMNNLDKYLEIQKRLADPRGTTPGQAAPMFAQGKNVVLLTCSIHATEVASTHSAVEFAYKMLTDDSPRFQAIRQNTILILVPSLNPDGVDIVTRWYRKTLGTPYEGTGPPELYQKYVGHDNNRDWYTFSQPETRATISQLHNVWHPEIVYDVHQQGANASRIFIPPWLDPYEPNVDAIIAQEMNMIGTSMATDLTAAGKVGVAINAAYDFWTVSRHYQAFHGGLRILTESASARLASPVTITKEQLVKDALGYNAQERSWNFLEPWEGGTWRLRDIIDYQLIAFESCLYNAAIHREEMLRNFYQVGQKAVARSSPYAFMIPAAQRDPGATRQMLETLAFGEVEIERAPNGDWVIRMQQPYSSYAKALLEKQDYPDLRMYPGGPPKRPYDVTTHCLPLLFGVDVRTIKSLPDELRREQYGDRPVRTSFSASDSDAWKTANRIWNSGHPVWRNEKSGDFSADPGSAGWKKLNPPRIALYKSFVPAMDEGWTRWLLENFGFAYTSVGNPEIQKGNLRSRFDVMVFPDQREDDLIEGYSRGSMPEEYTGGLGPKGAAALKDFTRSGGTLLFFNHSTKYAIDELGVRAKNVLEGVSNKQFYSPGSLLNATADMSNPLTRGLPKDIAIWSEQSPAFTSEFPAVVRYADKNVLASGWLLGDKLIAGKSALVDAKVGEGHIILFGMRPQYRAQSYQTFKLFFNALVY